MSFKNKENWKPYKRQAEIIEIKILDSSGQKIGDFKCVNQKDYSRVVCKGGIMESKFGYSAEMEQERKELNEVKERSWLDKDLEW